MNRLVTTNLDGVSADQLPPRQREGRVRVLFINCNILGLKTVATHLKRATATHPGVDAVHIDLDAPLWMRMLGKSLPVPGGWDLHSYRHLRLWGSVIRHWFRTSLPLDRFDVVQITTQGNAWGMLALLDAPVRWVLKIDGTAEQDVTDYGFSRTVRAPFIAAEHQMFDAADLVVSDTHWCNRSVHEDYGVPKARIYRATNGVEIPDRTRWDGPRPIDATPVRIAFVGNAWKRKGGDLLLDVHQRSLSDRAELHIIGDLKPVAPGARNVTWHGRVPRDTLLGELLPTMDLFSMPSRVDMAPFASVEAAAAGLPLVVPRLAGFPEVVRDGETGLLFETANVDDLERALVRLVDDAALRERLGRAAADHIAEEFNAARVYPAWIDRLVACADEPKRTLGRRAS